MLNYSKIINDIESSKKATYRSLASLLGIPDATFRSRLKGHNITPDDIEKLADYFNRSILYYYDREINDFDKPTSPDKHSPCTNPDCLVEIATLKETIRSLEYDKRILGGVIEKILQEGGTEQGKSIKGGVESHRKTG